MGGIINNANCEPLPFTWSQAIFAESLPAENKKHGYLWRFIRSTVTWTLWSRRRGLVLLESRKLSGMGWMIMEGWNGASSSPQLVREVMDDKPFSRYQDPGLGPRSSGITSSTGPLYYSHCNELSLCQKIKNNFF